MAIFNRPLRYCTTLVGTLLTVTPTTIAQTASFEIITTPQVEPILRLHGLSGDGSRIVGTTSAPPTRGYRWVQGAGIELLPYPGFAGFSTARGISRNGLNIVGSASDASGDVTSVPVVWSDGPLSARYVPLPPGQTAGYVFVVTNAADQYFGFCNGGAFYATNVGASLRPVDGASDYSEVNGVLTVDEGWWTAAGGKTTLSTTVHRAEVLAVSANGGTLVGSRTESQSPWRRLPARWTLPFASNVTQLPVPMGTTNASAVDVSADGSIICGHIADVPHVWASPASQPQRLVDLLTEAFGVSTDGWTLRTLEYMSDDGRVFAGLATRSGRAAGYRVVIPTVANSVVVSAESGQTFAATREWSARLEPRVIGSLPRTYQWSRNGVPLTEGGRFTGVNSRVLRIHNVTDGDAGEYVLHADNEAGPPADVVVTLNVVAQGSFVRYVNSAATGSADGSTWQNAFLTLSDALLAPAAPGTEVWVRGETHRPPLSNDPTSSIVLSEGVFIRGGFAGTETSPGQRLPAGPVTRLEPHANTTQTVWAANLPGRTDVERVSIGTGMGVGGNQLPDGGSALRAINATRLRLLACTFFQVGDARGQGGAVHARQSALELEACTFTNIRPTSGITSGGGGALAAIDATLTLRACKFEGNSTQPGYALCYQTVTETAAPGDGGAISLRNVTALIENCAFVGNIAPVGYPGGNCSFGRLVGNTAGAQGGAIFAVDSALQIARCRFIANTAGNGAGPQYSQGVPTTSSYAGGSGGAIHSLRGSLHVSDSFFHMNTAGNPGPAPAQTTPGAPGEGGAIFATQSVMIENCTFVANVGGAPATQGLSSTGGAVYLRQSPAASSIRNTVFRDNLSPNSTTTQPDVGFVGPAPVIAYSVGTHVGPGIGNLAAAPIFADLNGPDNQLSTIDDDPSLNQTSPGVDAGFNRSNAPTGVDVLGNPRYADVLTVIDTGAGTTPIIDMGAAEVTPTACDTIDFNRNDVFPEDQDVIDFFNTLSGAPCATCDDIDFNNNGVYPEDQDVIDFFNALAGGTCP